VYGDPSKGSQANRFPNSKWPSAIRFSAKRRADIAAFGTLFSRERLITARGTLRISYENLAHHTYTAWACSVLLASAILRLTGLTAFAANILGALLFEPSRAQKRPSVVGMLHGIA